MELWQLKQMQSLPLNQVLHGNSLEVLKTLEDNSVDSIVTDPPYELGFMGKKWDSTGIAYNVDLWRVFAGIKARRTFTSLWGNQNIP